MEMRMSQKTVQILIRMILKQNLNMNGTSFLYQFRQVLE